MTSELGASSAALATRARPSPPSATDQTDTQQGLMGAFSLRPTTTTYSSSNQPSPSLSERGGRSAPPPVCSLSRPSLRRPAAAQASPASRPPSSPAHQQRRPLNDTAPKQRRPAFLSHLPEELWVRPRLRQVLDQAPLPPPSRCLTSSQPSLVGPPPFPPSAHLPSRDQSRLTLLLSLAWFCQRR